MRNMARSNLGSFFEEKYGGHGRDGNGDSKSFRHYFPVSVEEEVVGRKNILSSTKLRKRRKELRTELARKRGWVRGRYQDHEY